MTLINTRPLSPQPGQPFTGYLIVVNAGQERTAIQIEQGNPSTEPVDLAPGRYNVEWIEGGKEPVFDVANIPDKPEGVELSEVCYSLLGKEVDKEAVQESVPQPQTAQEVGATETSSADPTVSMQPPATEQEVAGTNVTTKRKGAPDA